MKFNLPNNYVFNKEEKTCFFIKKRIEELSCIENIGERCRKWPKPDFRFIYSKLCREYTICSLDMIGFILGEYDHATILNNIKRFDNLFYTGQLGGIDIYNEISNQLDKKNNHKFISSTDRNQKRKPKLLLFNIIEKSNSIIKRQRSEINELKKVIYDN